MKLSTSSTPLKYFLSVLIGYCVDFAIFSTFVLFGISVYLSNTAGFCVGSTVNVVLIRRFVFRDNRFRLPVDLQLSLASNGLMFLFGMGLLWVLVDIARVNPLASKLIVNGVTFLINYMVRLVFFRSK